MDRQSSLLTFLSEPTPSKGSMLPFLAHSLHRNYMLSNWATSTMRWHLRCYWLEYRVTWNWKILSFLILFSIICFLFFWSAVLFSFLLRTCCILLILESERTFGYYHCIPLLLLFVCLCRYLTFHLVIVQPQGVSIFTSLL